MAVSAIAPYPAAIRVLTLTPFYPDVSDTSAGCFIAEPLAQLPAFAVNPEVITVRPFYRGRAQPSPDAPVCKWALYPALPGNLGLPSGGAFLSARLLPRVREMHLARPIDLIHAHAALPCGHAAMLLARALGIPYVVTAHGLDVFFANQVPGYLGSWCGRISRRVYAQARRVICVSRKVADALAAGANPVKNTTVIYNGVDSQLFAPLENYSPANTILSVGNLIPIKGHELLLRAIAAGQHKLPHVCCEIIGDGPERPRLEKLAHQLNIASRVRFLGRQSRAQVAQAMQRCVVFALPSAYEGLGCVYLEAMSTAKPVVACRGQGIAEIIEHERNGWLVEPADLRQLTTALCTLLKDSQLRRRLGAAARATMLQNFTVQHQAARMSQLYRECLA